MPLIGKGIRYLTSRGRSWYSSRYARARGMPYRGFNLSKMRPGRLRSAAIKAQRVARYVGLTTLKIALRCKLRNMRMRRR